MASAHSSSGESESSESDSSSDSESESSSSDSEEEEENEPLETRAPEVLRPLQNAMQDGRMLVRQSCPLSRPLIGAFPWCTSLFSKCLAVETLGRPDRGLSLAPHAAP